MVLTVLNAVKRLMGNAGLPGELSVGKLPAFLAQEFRQLPVQIALHAKRVTKTLSRMRDDLPLQRPRQSAKLCWRTMSNVREKTKLLVIEDDSPADPSHSHNTKMRFPNHTLLWKLDPLTIACDLSHCDHL